MQGSPMWDICISLGVVDLSFRIDPLQICWISTTCHVPDQEILSSERPSPWLV